MVAGFKRLPQRAYPGGYTSCFGSRTHFQLATFYALTETPVIVSFFAPAGLDLILFWQTIFCLRFLRWIACCLRRTLLLHSTCLRPCLDSYRLKTSSPPPCLLSSQPICSLISSWQWIEKPCVVKHISPLASRLAQPTRMPLSPLFQQHPKSAMTESAIAKFSVKID